MIDLATDDIASRQSRSPGYLASLEQKWATILKGLPEKVEDIDYSALQKYVLDRGESVRGQTIQKELTMIYRALTEAMHQGAIRQLPRRPKVRRDPKDKAQSGKRWPLHVLRLWMQHMDADARDEAMLALITQLRSAELKRLRHEHVELTAAGYILRLPGDATKTGFGRVVGIPGAALAIIQGRGESGYVLSRANHRKARETAARLCGLETAPTLRDLRHTGACVALEATGDAAGLMEALGHRDLRTTSIYLTSTVERVALVASSVAEAVA